MRPAEEEISRLIIDSFAAKLRNNLSCDVAVVGGGPSGLVCSYFLAKQRVKTVLFERSGSLGGGIWGGGMMFNRIVIQSAARRLLDEFKIRYRSVNNSPTRSRDPAGNFSGQPSGTYLIADAPEVASALSLAALRAGVEIFNFITAEDVMVKTNRICGLVLNWTAVEKAGFHVDPLVIKARYVVDATGHESQVTKVLIRKLGSKPRRLAGYPLGERPMNAELGEREVVRNSREIFPGLFVSGMAANAVLGGHRMGPIFGGMLLSGERVARLILKKFHKKTSPE
jgi:thiamine thiazole synthase